MVSPKWSCLSQGRVLSIATLNVQVLEEYGTAASMLPPLPPPSSASMQPSGVT